MKLFQNIFIFGQILESGELFSTLPCVCVLTLILLGNQSAFSYTLIGRYIGKYIINEMHDGEQKAIGELAFWQTTLQ